MISLFKKFEEEGILGINRRIGEYILPYNPREYYPLVDDKWKTAELARQFHVPMPHHYGVVDAFGGIRGTRELVQKGLDSLSNQLTVVWGTESL